MYCISPRTANISDPLRCVGSMYIPSYKGLAKLALGSFFNPENLDRPGKPPKPPLKAPKGDKQLGRLALFWGGRTPRGRASSISSHAHARTRTRAHVRP